MSVTDLGIDGLEDVVQIGTGGSSRVYRANQRDLDRVVAVKVINAGHDPDVARRFDRERKAMGRLSSHEGIVPVYSSGVTGQGEPYLVMPYFPHGSLQDQINAGPMPWEVAANYVDIAAETIAVAHDESVVHLDLKPANILLTATGAPRIADFGIAKITSTAQTSRTTGTAFTPAYSAPETFLDGDASRAADVYGLGATLWALLVGHPPFLAKDDDYNLMAVIGRVVNNPVGDIGHLAPPAICQVVYRAMEKHPENRYQTAREFSMALKEALRSSTTSGSSSNAATSTTAIATVAPTPATSAAQTAAFQTQHFDSQLPAMTPGSAAYSQQPAGFQPEADRGYPSQLATPSPGPVRQFEDRGPSPMGYRPPDRNPVIDIDRFRLGPLVAGLVALLGVGMIAAWALTRDSGLETESSGVASVSGEMEDPAGPTAEETTGADALDTSDDVDSSESEGLSSSTTSGLSAIGSETTTTRLSTTTTTLRASSSTTTNESTTSVAATTSSTRATTTTTDAPTTTTTVEESTTTTVEVPDDVVAPTDLEAEIVDGAVRLTWSAPAVGPRPTSYVIYRDGDVMGAPRRSPFVDQTATPGPRSYRISSVGAEAAESDLSAAVRIVVPEEEEPDPLEVSSSLVRVSSRTIAIQIESNVCMAGYRVSWTDPDGETEVLNNRGACIENETEIIRGLDTGTTYAINVIGLGDDDEQAAATPLQVTTTP